MKKALITLCRSVCRFIAAALWQLVWLIPLWGCCWYGKSVLPRLIRSHFGLDQLQDRLTSLEQFSDLMKNSSSLTNPTALMHYLSAQLSRFSLSTKLSTIEITANILEKICIWGLNLLWIAAVIYAVIRTFKLYRHKSDTYETATTVAQQILPHLVLLQQEIITLQEQVQSLKENIALTPPKEHENLLKHD